MFMEEIAAKAKGINGELVVDGTSVFLFCLMLRYFLN